jgi:hypothetical protein
MTTKAALAARWTFTAITQSTIRTNDDIEYSRVSSLADVDCKNESSKVLENSVIKPLVSGMNEVASGNE